MLQAIKERLGLTRLQIEITEKMDEQNMRVGIIASTLCLFFSVFILLNLYLSPDIQVTMTRELPQSMPLDGMEGQDPMQGIGSILGTVCVYLGARVDGDLTVVRILTFFILAFSVIVLMYSLLHHFFYVNRHWIIVSLIYLVPVFSAACNLTAYYFNGGRSMLMFFVVQLLIPVVFILRPAYEGIVTLVSSIGFAYVNQLQHGWDAQMFFNMAGFWLVTIVICTVQYRNKFLSYQLNYEMEKMSVHDELSGLKNRHGLHGDRELLCNRELYVLMIDLDDFKYYNDAFGHEFGDEVIRRFGEALMRNFRSETIYRYGGDEFLVLISEVGEEEFLERLRCCRDEMAKVKIGDEAELYLTASCGYVYGLARNWDNLREMCRLADQKLYEAKRLGKDRAVGMIYQETLDANKQRRDWGRVYKANDLDLLTKLPNKLHFLNRANKVLARTEDQSTMAVVYLNIENFRLYNMKYGFEQGDILLQEVADSLRYVFEGDLISRFGEDHFVILTKREGVAKRIGEIRLRTRSSEINMYVEIKAGIAVLRKTDTDIAVVCDQAQLACNDVKGRYDMNCRFYDNALNQKIHLRQYIAEHLEEAIQNEYLKVYYQPIVRVMTGMVCDCEALVRWQDPTMGLIPPNQFIFILEECHLIHRLDCFVVDRVCRDIRYALDHEMPFAPVSINLSRMDFSLLDMVEFIEEKVSKYRVPKSMLHIELTESTLIEQTEDLRLQIQRLRNSGYQAWMDDFGSGYSSLNVLKEYNFDVMKVDMTFLQDFGINKRSRKMITTIIHLAKDLGIQSLVEGVEIVEQYEFLKTIGCEKVQGFYFAQPTPWESWLEQGTPNQLLIEDASLRHYYDVVGSIDLMSPGIIYSTSDVEEESEKAAHGIPCCILELYQNRVHMLGLNFECIRAVKAYGYENVDAVLQCLNNPLQGEYNRVRMRMRDAKENEQQMEFIAQIEEIRFRSYMQFINEEEGHAAYYFMIMPLSKWEE